MALADVQPRNLRPRERTFKISDGGGLFLMASPKGSKLWRLAYRFAGKQKMIVPEWSGGDGSGYAVSALGT